MHYQDYGSPDVVDLQRWGAHRLAIHDARTQNDLHSAVIVRVIRHWKNLLHVRDARRSIWDAPIRRRKAN